MDRPEGFQRASSRRSPRNRPTTRPHSVAKAVSKKRKRAEKAEFKRLTPETRRRRITWGISLGSIAALMLSVTILTLSPVLALKHVVVEGSTRVPASEIEDALSHLYGEPLARIDSESVQEALRPLTLIQEFTTRVEPPNTLVVTVLERTPVGFVEQGARFVVVDASGLELWSEDVQPEGFPEITSQPATDPDGFQASVRVLSAVPEDVLAQIETVTARTLDTVRFSMKQSRHEVLWGSPDRSLEKARVLSASLEAAGAGDPKEIDITTPDSVVIRPQN